jgi:WD40 repeat protein
MAEPKSDLEDLSVKRSALNVERSASAGDADSPWPGLATFTEEQAGLFHGRDAEIRDLTRRAERNALTVLFGQSGLGKSSLLQAGVFPRLRANHYWPIYIRLDHGPGAPSPTEQIKALVQADTARAGAWTKPGSAKPGETLWEFFHHRDDKLVAANGRTIVPVLVFDQFEELFTLGAGTGGGVERARAVAFISELAELVENRPSEKLVARLEESSEEMDAFDFSRTDYRVVITLREDFLPHLESLKTIMPALMENRMRLARMSGTQALEAVVKPGGALVTEEVARAIVEFVAGAKGGSIERLAELDVEPPLLSVICRELNERRRSLGQAQITADLVSGNRREILTDFYERSVNDLPDGMRAFVEDHLLTKSGFRDNLALETALEFPGVTRPLIDTLVARRLLRIEDRLGVQRVELTHDVLAEVIRASRDARNQRVELAAAARQTRRQRWLICVLAVAVAGLSIGAFFGIRAQRNATHQAGRADLLLGARLLDEGKLADGLAYLVSAGRKDPANPIIAPRILTTLVAQNFFLPVGSPLSLPSPGLGALYTHDGRRIFVQTEDDVLRVINAQEWKLEREVKFDQKIRRFGVRLAEKNSEVFAVVLVDNTILVCDVATGQPRIPPIRPPDRVFGRTPMFGLSPDGRWIAAASQSSVWVWEASSGKLRATLPNEYNRYPDFTFSPDSRRIVTTHGAGLTQMWSIPDGAPVGKAIETGEARWGAAKRFSDNGKKLLVINDSGVLVADTGSGELIRPFLPLGSWWDVLVTSDGRQLLIVNASTVSVLDLATGQPAFPPFVHDGPVYEWKVSADGSTLFTNSVDGTFRLWDLKTGKLLAESTFRQEQFAPAAFSADGRTVAVFSASGVVYHLRLGAGPAAPLLFPRDATTVAMVNVTMATPTRLFWLTTTRARIFDAASGRETGTSAGSGLALVVRTLPADKPRTWRAWTFGDRGIDRDVALAGVPDGVDYFNLNPTGQLAAATGTVDSNAVGIWNLQTGRLVTTIKAENPIARFTTIISPDQRRVAFRTDDAETRVVHVCDIASGRELSTVQISGKASINTFRFTADSTRLVSGDDWGGVHFWDAATGQLQRSTQGHRAAVRRIDFSPDGRYFATASEDGSVQTWDSVTGAPAGPLLTQKGSAGKPDFSPDNARIVTQSSAGTVRVWDVRSGQPLTPLLDHDGATMNIAAYGPDGRFLQTYATGIDGKRTVRLWSAPPDGKGAATPAWLLRLATVCAGRRLADDGKIVNAADTIAKMDEIRREIAALPDDAPYVEWARWFLSDSATRSIGPGFTITPAEAVKLREDMAAGRR